MKLALGTAQFGLNYGISNTSGVIEQQEIKNIFNIARKHSIDLLDTAQSYGESEARIGLAGSKGFKIITKIPPGINFSDIKESIHGSLLRLRKDSLDGVLIHDFKDYQNNPEILDILFSLKRQGLIKKVGFSLYYPRELEILFSKNIDFDIVQIPFNVFDQRFKPYFSKLKNSIIDIHARSVFLQGIVFIEPRKLSSHFSTHIQQIKNFYDDVSNSDCSIATTCLYYIYSHPEIDISIIGVSNSEELLTNIIAFEECSKKAAPSILNYSSYSIDDERIILPFNWK